jgi:hypothetical protein
MISNVYYHILLNDYKNTHYANIVFHCDYIIMFFSFSSAIGSLPFKRTAVWRDS